MGWDVYGIRRGYHGLMDGSGVMQLTRDSVRGITHLGGTIIGTTNKGNPFEFPVKTDSGVELKDLSDQIVQNFKTLGFDALIAIGGDGSLRIAHKLFQKGIPVVGVPKTIDNDLSHTVVTFGFDTAVQRATEAVDCLHSTAEAHERVMILEVMGRYAGWIALNSGVAGTADVILIPEIPFDVEKVCRKIKERELRGRHFAIVVVAEGAKPHAGEMKTKGDKEPGREVKLGGMGEEVARMIQDKTGRECRTTVLGHLQRGGTPTTFDRLIALRFGAAAVRFIKEGKFGHMVALDPPGVKAVPMEKVTERSKFVPLDCDTMQTARELGICFGD
jgi:6-phosphofructokinase 1